MRYLPAIAIPPRCVGLPRSGKQKARKSSWRLQLCPESSTLEGRSHNFSRAILMGLFHGRFQAVDGLRDGVHGIEAGPQRNIADDGTETRGDTSFGLDLGEHFPQLLKGLGSLQEIG